GYITDYPYLASTERPKGAEAMQWWTDHSWIELTALVLAFVLSASIGMERQRRLKNAGLRTHTLVGIGSAGFALASQYGFTGVLGDHVTLDPSRVAAIGCLGAGGVFGGGRSVSGFTTAASVWVGAAVGLACGAGLRLVAVTLTVLYFAAIIVLTRIARKIAPGSHGDRMIIFQYRDGSGALREALETAAKHGFAVFFESSRQVEDQRIEARVRLAHTRRPPEELAALISDMHGVTSIYLDD